jgi:hypothetical protein
MELDSFTFLQATHMGEGGVAENSVITLGYSRSTTYAKNLPLQGMCGIKLMICCAGSDFAKVLGVASSASVFVSKVETWLRFNGLPYTKKEGDTRDAPLGKVRTCVCINTDSSTGSRCLQCDPFHCKCLLEPNPFRISRGTRTVEGETCAEG